MSSLKVVVILSVLISGLTADSSLRCTDGWIQLNREKCYKVVSKSGTWEEANTACGDTDGPYLSSLLTIKSYVEQRILQRYLYNQLYITDNVWLDTRRDNSSAPFQWDDGSSLRYTNWDQNRPSSDRDSNCAQFDPRSTKWTDTSCSSKGVIVCQKLQMWTFPELLEEFFEWRQDIERKVEELEEEIEERDEKIESLENRFDNINDKYNSLSEKFNDLSEKLEKKLNDAIDKLQDQNEKISEGLSKLDDKTDKLDKDVEELKKECSKGCSDDGSDGGVSDSQIESLRKELKAEIEKRVTPIENKVDNSVTDARLQIISYRRTLQIKKRDDWISLGHV